MRSDKKLSEDTFGRQHELMRRAYASALTMRERFPQVESLVLDIAFSDGKGNIKYSSQVHTFSAAAKGFFAVPCPATLCREGGFDLDAIILSMLKADRTSATGELKCHGWVSPSHTPSTRCHVQMHYELQARYDESKGSHEEPKGGNGRRR